MGAGWRSGTATLAKSSKVILMPSLLLPLVMVIGPLSRIGRVWFRRRVRGCPLTVLRRRHAGFLRFGLAKLEWLAGDRVDRYRNQYDALENGPANRQAEQQHGQMRHDRNWKLSERT